MNADWYRLVISSHATEITSIFLFLLDAYNLLQNDRVNDKEQFVQAILLIVGQILGDSLEEENKKYEDLRKNGLLMLENDSRAEWLTRQFDEASVELLRKSIEEDIYNGAMVPRMSDESFAANISGVAMKYKLMAFEQLTGIKERYFREGLRYRLKLFCNVLAVKGGPAVNPDDIDIIFTRSLPVNELEQAQIMAALGEDISLETKLSRLSFVEDPAAEAERVRKERAEKLADQQAYFRVHEDSGDGLDNEK